MAVVRQPQRSPRDPALGRHLCRRVREHESSLRRWNFSSAVLHLTEPKYRVLIERGRGWSWNGIGFAASIEPAMPIDGAQLLSLWKLDNVQRVVWMYLPHDCR